MTAPKPKTVPRAKPSGIKSESALEAGQIRKLASLVAALTDRVSTLERAAVALSRNNLAVAQEELGSQL